MKKLSCLSLMIVGSLLTGCEAIDYAGQKINYGLSYIPGTQQHQQRKYRENMPRRSAYDGMYDAQMSRRCSATVWSSDMRGAMGCR